MSMKRFSLVLFALAGLLGWQTANAQLEIGAQVRPRAEYRHGFKKPLADGLDPAFFTEQRTRLIFGYKAENLKLGISFQDVRVWGDVSQINKSDALNSFHEAYAEYNFTPEFSVKAGRQELKYDDARILGNLDWAAQGRSHDALVFKYADSAWALHVGMAYNQKATPAEPAKLADNFYSQSGPTFAALGGGLPNPKQLYYAWFDHSVGAFSYSALALGTGWQLASDSSTNFMWTIGVNPAYKISGKLKAFGSFYYQTGKNGADKDVSAMLASLNLGYTASSKVSFTLGGDYVSGQDPDADADEWGAFDPLFGTHHKFYGFMDYFYVGNAHGNKGLINPYLKTSVKTSGKTSLNIHLHQFLAATEIVGTDGEAMSSSLGTEIDLGFVVKCTGGMVTKIGYSQMIYTDSMQEIKGTDTDRTANWAYLMLVFNPTILKL